jgi:MFS family permease
MNLGFLAVLQTLPALLLLPLSGVIIDREDRRHLVMLLDAARGIVIACVAVLAMRNEVELWHLYAMNTLVALGFWMFWPSVTALIQELTPESEFVNANTLLMAGVQGGWLIAGAIVGFLYDHIGLGPILLIDVGTYVCSFLLYLNVRKGKHLVTHPHAQGERPQGAVARYFHEVHEGIAYVRSRPAVIALGTSWALFLGAMLTQNVTTAPLSERILHAGATGYGWLNGAWGVGAFVSAIYTATLLQRLAGRRTIAIGMATLALGMFFAPFSHWVVIAAVFFFLMGSARGLVGIALGSTMMELVPKHMMGRVQNTFYFFGMLLQMALSVAVGAVAHRWSLSAAFFMIGAVYGTAFLLSVFPVHESVKAPAVAD